MEEIKGRRPESEPQAAMRDGERRNIVGDAVASAGGARRCRAKEGATVGLADGWRTLGSGAEEEFEKLAAAEVAVNGGEDAVKEESKNNGKEGGGEDVAVVLMLDHGEGG